MPFKRLTRGCGHRVIGGLYLVAPPLALTCRRLPLALPSICPCCNQGMRFARGFSWIDPFKLFQTTPDDPTGIIGTPCDHEHCRTCVLGGAAKRLTNKEGLLWVGEKFYSASSFVAEAQELGISKRISRIPRGFQVGKTWIFLAHNKALWQANINPIDLQADPGSVQFVPGVFAVFLPQRIEMPVPKDTPEEKLEVLRSRGITPVPCEVDGYGRAIEMIETPEEV